MLKYCDDIEFVKIALKHNGSNIEFVSPRLRDDIEVAKYAITHQQERDPYSTFCNLSKRLRNNLELALLDIKEGHACVKSYSKRLQDSDDVAEALIACYSKKLQDSNDDNKILIEFELEERLHSMSERIQKIYDIYDIEE